MTALLAPRPEQEREAPPPGLHPVAPLRRPVRSAGFIAAVAALLGSGMIGALILTTVLQDAAFKVEEKQAEATALANQVADLQTRVANARSVQNLAVSAQKLGMKPNTYPVQLRVSDGVVVGDATQVTGGEVPSVRYVTDEQAARELEARRESEAKAKADAAAKKQADAAAKQAAAEAKAAQDAAAAQAKAAADAAAAKAAADAAAKTQAEAAKPKVTAKQPPAKQPPAKRTAAAR